MLCPHLAALERALLAAGIPLTFRGQPWSSNCREWVYFDCWLDRPSLRARLQLDECVIDHEHRGTHDGQEAGFVCSQCWDGIMGRHAASKSGAAVFQ